MKNPDVLIIGAGVIGASVAWHLATAGVRRILMIDRAPNPVSGSTARATGGFRAQFGSGINVRLSLLSREKLLRFEEEVGVDPGYVPAGYLFVAAGGDDLENLLAAGKVQQAAGFHEVVTLDHQEVQRLNPHLDPATHIGGTFSPRDGFLRPLQIAEGYLAAAGRLGVEVQLCTESLSLRTSGGRVTGVRSSGGEIEAGCVVNAGGAWAAGIVRDAGIDLPVRPLRRQVACTRPTALLPDSMPMTIFSSDGFHFRPRDGRVLLLWPDEPVDPENEGFDEGWLATISRMTRERVPGLASVPIDRSACWSGMYEMSPDCHVILGRSSELENLYLVNGSSGHGVMHAPALGQLLSEIIILGQAEAIDTSALRPSRFAERAPIAGSALL